MEPIVTILAPGRSERNYWRDLWRFRELFQVLAWRDLAVRYKQTVIGVAWAIIRPVLAALVFNIVFGQLAKLPTDGSAPYPLLVMAGVLPWTFFSTALTEASNSLVSNANLISKVYFPRLVVPTASVVVALVDFLIGCLILFAMMAWYRFPLSWHVLFLPAFILLTFFVSLGPGLLLSSLNVKYRDFRYIVPFIVQFGMYVSPVGFSSSIIPESWRFVYALNPLVGIIDGFRWCLLGGNSQLHLLSLGISVAITAGMLWIGVRYFRKTERGFADMI